MIERRNTPVQTPLRAQAVDPTSPSLQMYVAATPHPCWEEKHHSGRLPLPWNSQRPADTGDPKDLSQISKCSLDSAPAEKMQGVLLLAGTSQRRSADSRSPLKSLGPVSVSAKKNPPCQFPPFPPVLQKDEARREAQESAPTAAPPVIQEITGTASPRKAHRAGASANPSFSPRGPADGEEEPLPLNFLALKKKYRI